VQPTDARQRLSELVDALEPKGAGRDGLELNASQPPVSRMSVASQSRVSRVPASGTS
jgi:hypothetical protein